MPTCATVLTRNIQCPEVETHTSVLLGSFFAADTERSIKLRSDSCFRPYMMAQLIVQDLVVLDRRRKIVDNLNHFEVAGEMTCLCKEMPSVFFIPCVGLCECQGPPQALLQGRPF
jgi:hypothetical protein